MYVTRNDSGSRTEAAAEDKGAGFLITIIDGTVMKVTVTREDIDATRSGDEEINPIVHAIDRIADTDNFDMLKLRAGSNAGELEAQINEGGEELLILVASLPDEARRLIHALQAGGSAEPVEFDIEWFEPESES